MNQRIRPVLVHTNDDQLDDLDDIIDDNEDEGDDGEGDEDADHFVVIDPPIGYGMRTQDGIDVYLEPPSLNDGQWHEPTLTFSLR